MNQESLERYSIGDGIHLNFIRNDRYKTNYITFYFVTPLNRKTASYNTLLSRVLTRGSRAYPTQMELNRVLDHCYDASLSSDTEKVGEWHAISVSLGILDNAFSLDDEDIAEKGLEILENVLFDPFLPGGAFDEAYVDGEKKLALLEIASQINNKARFSRSRMIEVMCRLEPYSTCSLGDKRVLRTITPALLTEYYRELLKTAQVEIFFVGRFDQSVMKEKTERFFAGRERCVLPLPEISIRTKARSVKEVTETMDITQANLVMGFRTASTIYDKHWRAMSLYNSVLGGSLTSKLFCVLREKMSLCYSISSSPDAMKGIMMIYAGIAPENRDVAVKETLHQMDLIREGRISDEELENARGAIVHAMNSLGDNPAVLAQWYLPRVLTNTVQTPQEIVQEIKEITKEDVMRVAERIQLDTVYTLTGKEEQK